ncbi:MAG TPA: flippase [Terriglobales bacterium]|nr:flippase [Terriglobales bacterium]
MSAATNISQPEISVLVAEATGGRSDFRRRIASISRQSFVYFAGTILTAAAGYFFKIYLARVLGAEALGLYALGMTMIGFAGIVNSIGLPTAAAKFVAAYLARGEHSALVQFLRSGFALLSALNVLLAAAIVIIGPWVATHFYHAPQLNTYLWAFAAMMAFGVFNAFLAQVMAGYQDVARRTLITHFIGTPATIATAVALISLGFGLRGYLVAQVASAVLVLALLCRCVWKMTPRPTTTIAAIRFEPQVLSFSAVACGMSALQFALAQTDMIVLGHYVNSRQLGIYAVAMAVVGFVSIALDSVNQIFSPIISELHAAENRVLLQQLYSTLTKWIVIATLPMAVTLALFSRSLMSIFGPSFQPGAGVLALGTIGQLVNCAVGSVGYLLLMSGNQTELIKIEAVNAGILILLNLILVPPMGITGAAVAVAITAVTTNVWALASVRRLLNIFPYRSGHFRLLGPALITTACIWALSRISVGAYKPWQFAGFALIAGYVIFLVAIYLVGFEHDDRELAKLAWGKLGRHVRKFATA